MLANFIRLCFLFGINVKMISIERHSVAASSRDKLVAGLIFLYWLLYENVFFFQAGEGGVVFVASVNFVKLGLPLALLWYSSLSTVFFVKGFESLYCLFFTILVSWIGVVTLAFGDVFEWIKLFPRLIFFYSVLTLLYKKPVIFDFYAKLLILYVLFTLVQYFLIYLTNSTGNRIYVLGVPTAGIGGLYANMSSAMSFPGLSMRVVRFAGYWNEPSNAAGTAMAAGFLAVYLRKRGYKARKGLSFLCFMGGFLALSNAGYFALALGSITYIIFNYSQIPTAFSVSKKVVILSLPLVLLVLALVGRFYVMENELESTLLRAIFGVRDLGETDAYGNRGAILFNVLNFVAENPLGRGLYVPDLINNPLVSASAPVYWLYTGGVIGILCLGLRELFLIKSALSLVKINSTAVPLFAALAAVMGQQLVYGSWMNPNYLVLAAALLAFNARSRLIS